MTNRELDALVAEQVMGLSKDLIEQHLPKYSANIADAWTLVDKINRWHFSLTRDAFGLTTCYRAVFKGIFVQDRIEAKADTAAKAICLASLKAVGYTEAI